MQQAVEAMKDVTDPLRRSESDEEVIESLQTTPAGSRSGSSKRPRRSESVDAESDGDGNADADDESQRKRARS